MEILLLQSNEPFTEVAACIFFLKGISKSKIHVQSKKKSDANWQDKALINFAISTIQLD